jgi:hypothetical protein
MSLPSTAVKPWTPPPVGRWSARGIDFGVAVAQGVAAAVVFTGVGTLALISHGLVRTAVLVAVALMFTVLGCVSIARLISFLTRPPGPSFWGARDIVRGAGLVAGATLACLSVLTAVLVQNGTVPAHTSAHNARLLADLDGWYAWNALNLIPLLSVPKTLGWSQPDVVGGHLAGVLMLIFKLSFLAVFLRLIVLAFRATIAEPGWWSGDGLNVAYSSHRPITDEEAAARKVQEFHNMSPGSAALLRKLAMPISPETSMEMRKRKVRVQTAVECASAVVAVVGAIVVVHIGSFVVEMCFLAACAAYSFWSFAQTASDPWSYLFGLTALKQTGRLRFYAILDRVAAFVRVTVIFVLVTALLDDLGVVNVVGLPASDKVTAGQAATFYVWNSLNAIPGLDIPSTLSWQLTHPLTDIVSRALLLIYKAFILFPLLGLLYLLILKLWGETPWSEVPSVKSPGASKPAEPHS